MPIKVVPKPGYHSKKFGRKKYPDGSDIPRHLQKNTSRENRLEELGRVDAERADTRRGARNLKDEKKRIVRELKATGGQARPKFSKLRNIPKRKFGAGRNAPTPKSGKGLSKNVLDNIKPEDIYQLKGSDLEIVLPSKKYKKGGLIKGKPKLAKRGWK